MIILNFDDNYIQPWAEASPWMRKQGIKATFYVCYPDKYSLAEFRALRILEEAGHEIGYHGLTHSRAALAGYPVDRNNPRLDGERQWKTLTAYIKGEIQEGMEILAKEGIKPRHFAYPFGSRSLFTDKALLQIFDSLRMGGGGIFPAGRQLPQIWGARNFDKPKADALLPKSQGKILALLMHPPTAARLTALANYAQRNRQEFLTVTEARALPGGAGR